MRIVDEATRQPYHLARVQVDRDEIRHIDLRMELVPGISERTIAEYYSGFLWRSSEGLRMRISSGNSSILPLACKLIPLTIIELDENTTVTAMPETMCKTLRDIMILLMIESTVSQYCVQVRLKRAGSLAH